MKKEYVDEIAKKCAFNVEQEKAGISEKTDIPMSELEKVVVYLWAQKGRAKNILHRLLQEPHGCPFCHSGKIINPDKPHDHTDVCAFEMAERFMADDEDDVDTDMTEDNKRASRVVQEAKKVIG